jgi:peptide/nickel transport system permease protein
LAVHVIRRLIALPIVLFGVSVVVFFALHLAPGNPALLLLGPLATPHELAALTRQLGLDRPLWVQYGDWLATFVTGHWGESIQMRTAVAPLVLSRLANTVVLAVAAFVVSTLLGLAAGILAGRYPNAWPDALLGLLDFVGLSVPVFWLGLLLVALFSLTLPWFPVGGMYDVGVTPTFGQLLDHLVLPTLSLAVVPGTVVSQITRNALVEEAAKQYVRTALAKGNSRPRALYLHALRNAWIPIVTTLGLEINYLIGGDVLVETVFNWPGIGQLLVTSVIDRDYPVVLASTMLLAIIFIAVNLAVETLYSVIDPRVKA